MDSSELMSKKETVEIVRCRHCEKWDSSWQAKTECGRGHCGELDMLTPSNWWCADGKEKRDERVIRCKECKYYHEDFWGEIDGLPMPIIIAHQICSKWGGGCKTIEDGYCHFGEVKDEPNR